jgi:hypothetical protein
MTDKKWTIRIAVKDFIGKDLYKDQDWTALGYGMNACVPLPPNDIKIGEKIIVLEGFDRQAFANYGINNACPIEKQWLEEFFKIENDLDEDTARKLLHSWD